MVSGPTFHAWLELAVASRTDPELRDAVQELTATLRALIVETFHDLFGPARADEPFFAVAPQFIFALLDGLALERIAGTDEAQLARVLDATKALARLVMPQATRQEDDSHDDSHHAVARRRLPDSRGGARCNRRAAASRDVSRTLVARLSHQSVVKHFDAYADIAWDDPEFRIDPDGSALGAGGGRRARRDAPGIERSRQRCAPASGST